MTTDALESSNFCRNNPIDIIISSQAVIFCEKEHIDTAYAQVFLHTCTKQVHIGHRYCTFTGFSLSFIPLYKEAEDHLLQI